MTKPWRPGRWWRVTYDGGLVWAEVQDEHRARESLARCPYESPKLYRLYERAETEWREIEP